MARCGCSGKCSCKITAGTGVDVSGTGTPADPFIVSATGGGSGAIDSVVAGNNITVDSTDTANPIVAVEQGGATDGQVLTWSDSSGKYVPEEPAMGTGTVDSVVAGDNVAVDSTDAANPVVSLGDLGSIRSQLALSDYDKLMPWFAALSNRKGARANVVVMGDSAIEGYPVTSYDRTAPSVLAELLRANHPTVIDGDVIPGGRGYIAIPSAFYTTGDPGTWPLALTGGALDSGTLGGFGAKHLLWYANAATGTPKVVDTLVKPVTSFDLNLTKGTAGGMGTAYYKIDSGSQITQSMAGATNASAKVHIASPATTSIEFGWLASGYAILEGITEYNGDESAGITVHNTGYSGATAAFWNTDNTVWPLSLALLAPHLLIISLGANDASTAGGGGSRSATDWKTDMTTLIAAIRSGAVTCPIVLSMMWDSPVTKVDAWSDYVAVAQEIAAADDTVICVDHSARMPVAGSTEGTALGLYYTDDAHGNPNGNAYTYMAETLYAAISPR